MQKLKKSWKNYLSRSLTAVHCFAVLTSWHDWWHDWWHMMTWGLCLQLCKEAPNQFQCQGVVEDAVRRQRGNKIRFSAGWAGLGWAGWRVTALPQHIPLFVPLGQPAPAWAGLGNCFGKFQARKEHENALLYALTSLSFVSSISFI